jgi:hypothetical protein
MYYVDVSRQRSCNFAPEVAEEGAGILFKSDFAELSTLIRRKDICLGSARDFAIAVAALVHKY